MTTRYLRFSRPQMVIQQSTCFRLSRQLGMLQLALTILIARQPQRQSCYLGQPLRV